MAGVGSQPAASHHEYYSGRTAVVTAADAIGEAVVRTLLAVGAKVVALVPDIDHILETVGSDVSEGTFCPIYVEIDSAESILDASKAVKAQLPPDGLHLLVNCSGGEVPATSFSDTTLEDFDRSYAVHVRAPWLLTRELLPHLTAAKGAVVNVACQPPVHTYPPCFPYGVSKAALSHASNVGCRELASASVRLNMISPGASAGPAGSSVAPTTVAVDQPQEVAEAVLFLGNGVAAGFITGTELEVAGGATLQSADAAAAAAAAPS